ncbi:hypothetical protein BCT19_08065 [Vibrio splendidus]|nr:hypothetical protein BCT19_08065 [Vibrio splendidus]
MSLTNLVHLITIVLIPLLAVVGGIGVVLGPSSFKLDAKNGLLNQGLLWLAILLPISYFFVFGFIAWEGYTIEISSKGLIKFFEISKIPLTFISLALPLTILVARFHSTEQTATQIAITSHKNNLDSFYAHRKEMFSYFSQLEETDYFGALTAEFKVHPRLHKNFFVGAPNEGFPELNQVLFKQVESTLASARMEIDAVLTCNEPELAFDLYLLNACVTIHSLSRTLGLREIYQNVESQGVLLRLTVRGTDDEYLSVGTTTDQLVASYRYAHDYFQNLCDFAGYTIEPTPDNHKYIQTGGKFRTINTPKVIEQLHVNKISRLLQEQV